MSTATEKSGNSILKWIFLGLAFIVLVTIIGLGIKSYKANHPPKEKGGKVKTESVVKAKIVTLPAMYTEYHLLKKGEVVRVNVPSGYNYALSGGGKKYYSQPQNTPYPEIRGDGKEHKTGNHVAYTDLSCYGDEEITVVCEFKKIVH